MDMEDLVLDSIVEMPQSIAVQEQYIFLVKVLLMEVIGVQEFFFIQELSQLVLQAHQQRQYKFLEQIPMQQLMEKILV